MQKYIYLCVCLVFAFYFKMNTKTLKCSDSNNKQNIAQNKNITKPI